MKRVLSSSCCCILRLATSKGILESAMPCTIHISTVATDNLRRRRWDDTMPSDASMIEIVRQYAESGEDGSMSTTCLSIRCSSRDSKASVVIYEDEFCTRSHRKGAGGIDETQKSGNDKNERQTQKTPGNDASTG